MLISVDFLYQRFSDNFCSIMVHFDVMKWGLQMKVLKGFMHVHGEFYYISTAYILFCWIIQYVLCKPSNKLLNITLISCNDVDIQMGRLSDGEKDFIIYFLENGGVTRAELDRRFDYSKSSITGFIDSLSNRGMTEFSSDNKFIWLIKCWRYG